MLIGIDYGGTKLEALAIDESGATLDRRRVPTPRNDYRACVEAVGLLVEAVEAKTGRRGTVGIGIPGAISPVTGTVMNANSTWNMGHRLDRDLEERLGREVRIENDANCFAVSEAVDGAAAGARVVWGIIVGTGTGSGIAIEGRAIGGRNRIAGEMGHNPLPRMTDAERPGPPCYCGRHGCVETFVSGPGFARDHREATGRDWPAPQIVEAMRAGDAGAAEAFDRYLDRLARTLAEGVNFLDPDAIVLGGGMSNVAELYRDLPERIRPHIFGDGFSTPVVPPVHGDSSGVRGAAWLWKA